MPPTMSYPDLAVRAMAHAVPHPLEYQKGQIRCPGSDYGCSWEGLYEELTEHSKICPIKMLKPIFEGYNTQAGTVAEYISQVVNQLKTTQIEKKTTRNKSESTTFNNRTSDR